MSENKQGKISIGVGLAPLVVCKKDASVGEKIPLQYISGLTFTGVTWSKDGSTIIQTDSDNTVTFNEPGIYRLIVLGYPQHKSYNINVT
jgi:hypothetical protein